MSDVQSGTRHLDEALRGWSLWTLVERRAALGDKLLLATDDGAVSYGDLYSSALRLAAGFERAGVASGDTVAMFGFNSADAVRVLFACAAMGAIFAPLNVALHGGDLGYVLNDVRPRMLIADAELLPTVLALDPPPPIERIVVRDSQGSGGFADLADLLSDPRHATAQPLDPAAAVAVIYTGGSTGMPKGVLVSHTYFIGSGIRYQQVTSAAPDDVHFSGGHQLFHSGGLQLALIGPMYVGMSSYLARRFSVSTYWQRAREAAATIIDPIGPMIAALVRQPASDQDSAHSVRVGVGSATGQIPRGVRDEFERRFALPLLEVYSQTETGGVLMCSERVDDVRPGSCGRSNGWADLAVLDDHDYERPPGAVGEIVARPRYPNTFMIGYLNQPTQTMASRRNLWHHTGDLGYLDEEGYLYFAGRQAHWLRRRGENISCFEVEQCILRLDSIAECAVVGVPNLELGEEDVKAYVVCLDGDAVSAVAIYDWCREHLAHFKAPRYIEFVASLPRSAAKNEIERHQLRDRGVGDCWDSDAPTST